MRKFPLLVIGTLVLSLQIAAQDDEIRKGTGMPMQIGDNVRAGDKMNVSGKISIEGVKQLKRLPVITITIIYAGAPADRAIANDEGYFVVRNVPRNNVSILIEIDGIEMLRQPIVASPMGNPRFDYTVAWPPANSLERKPGVVVAGQSYVRSEKNEAIFKQAESALRAKDAATASKLFAQILESEPKDFVSWTELGTIYFKANSIDNAEACYFKAIEIKKDYSVALLNLGKLYLLKKQSDNAILVLSNAVKAGPNVADAHHFLGEAYLQSKKGDSAVYHFNEAIKLAPEEKAELHLRIAALYDAAKMKDKAAAEYKLFLAKTPDYPERATLEKYIAENPPK